LNPGSPAPQASVLILTRPRAQNTGLRCCESIKGKIVTTLIKLKNRGLAEGTLRNVSFNLKHLAKHSNLDNPESVKEYIAKKNCANSQKTNLVKSYNYYAVVNGIQWIKPYYTHERKLPKIPTTEQIKKLIASASPRYATILKILSETGIMPHELSRISLRDIDLERGLLNVQGYKGHNSRVFKLKACMHYKNHYLPKVMNRDDPLDQLDRLGQSRLKRAILRGIKYSRTHHRCSCDSLRSLRRKGIIYVYEKCVGWVPAYEARRIRQIQREEKKKKREKSVLLLRQRTRY
jgi:integrase